MGKRVERSWPKAEFLHSNRELQLPPISYHLRTVRGLPCAQEWWQYGATKRLQALELEERKE